jgi:hypothetical protein
VPYQALHIVELEEITPSLTTDVLLKSLEGKTADASMAEWSLERYFAGRIPGFERKWHPWLLQIWDDFVSPFDRETAIRP